ncbi:hypothetical protein [Brevibacillus brevis]|uniref:hypothetical protein n=1 Tax=Brevibacillus brevis TaxID=1393 RepID=UPI001477426C|nr:hypothetical protein [Brevibacillus brevis]
MPYQIDRGVPFTTIIFSSLLAISTYGKWLFYFLRDGANIMVKKGASEFVSLIKQEELELAQ